MGYYSQDPGADDSSVPLPYYQSFLPKTTPTGALYGDQGVTPSDLFGAIWQGVSHGFSPQGFTDMARQGLQQPTDFLNGIDPNSRQPAVTPSDRLNVLAHWFTNNMGPQTVAGTLAGPMEGALGAGPIRAYHGSPYNFDAFDLSKIGTGEGAQAYGHGLYFAEAEPVARQYRDQLQWRGSDWEDPQVLASNSLTVHGSREAAADNLQMALDSTKKFYGSNIPAPQAASNAKTEQAISLLRGNEPITGKPATPGSMYEVNLHADPASLLDWDKPLAQQPPALRNLLNATPLDPTGRGAYRRLAGQLSVTRGPDGGIIVGNPSPLAASQALNEAGVPGIRYLDAGSRASGDGTRNYVMFNPNLIEILRKYGLAGMTVGAGGLGAVGADQR